MPPHADVLERPEAAGIPPGDHGLVDGGGASLADPDAEATFIGLLLSSPSKFGEIVGAIIADDFFDPLHRRIFDTLQRSFDDGYVVGIKELVAALGGDANANIGGGKTVAQYIASLIANANPKFDIHELAQYLNECAERRAVGAANDVSFGDEEIQSKFHAIPWRDIDLPGAEHDWLIKGILTRGERSLCAGPSGSGKSFVILDMALAIARGVPYAGRKVKRGLVIYQAGEGGRGLKKRIRAYRQHHNIDAEADLPFVLLPAAVDLYANDADVISLIKEIEAWSAQYKRVTKVDLELVVIDTLSAATPGANENASEDMSRVLARCARIAAVLGCHVMLVHHLNAAGSKPRGHSSLFANIENAIEILPTDRTVSGGDRPDGTEIRRKVRRARITKQKDGEDGLAWEFLLKQVVIGHDVDGDPITSCVVIGLVDDREIIVDGGGGNETVAQAPLGLKLTERERLLFECILDAQAEHGVTPPAELRLPHSIARVVDYKFVKELVGKRMLNDGEESAANLQEHKESIARAIRRAREKLMSLRVIGVDNPFVWWTGKPITGIAKTQPKMINKPQEALPEDAGDLF